MSFQELYFSFAGRIPRSDYWLKGAVPFMVIYSLFGFADELVGAAGVLSFIFSLALLWPALAMGCKRCHDRGKSGRFQFLYLIPIVGAIWALVDLGLLKGTDGENEYGPDPLAI